MRMLVPMMLALCVGCVSPSARTETAAAPDATAQAPASAVSEPAPDAAAPAPPGYTACGCGCCGGAEPQVKCLGTQAELEKVIAKDKADAKSPDCAMAGCTVPTRYQLCDAP
ncbi:hypothetical protein [Corallococcus sp. CA047B]|uniref:hypothetical protein n=1 Tax=Corallococcus sp. CA047B TaxID=2316729 RepID=UPI001315071B|nr:hypothetical protein [Corallococcus sp. CA047B]